VSQDQARAVAHEFSDKLWDLHKWIGYVLCGLLISRIFIEFSQPGEEKFRVKLKKAPGYGETQQQYIRVKNIYLVFYGLILIMALTGLGLAFESLPFLKPIHTPVKKIHIFVQYFIYGFILIHLTGVLKADMGNHRGLVSGMIHGKKRV
jgi:cytochrome b561